MPERLSREELTFNQDEAYFEDILAKFIVDKDGTPLRSSERIRNHGFSMKHTGTCIRATSHQESLGAPPETHSGFFNGAIVPLPDGGYALGGRLSETVSADKSNESLQAFKKFTSQDLMTLGKVNFHELNRNTFEPIKPKDGQSIEDMRFTPTKDGVVALGVALNGMYLKMGDGSVKHIKTSEWSQYEDKVEKRNRIWDINLVLAKCDPNLDIQAEAVAVLGGFDEKGEFHGYKNGVFLGTGEDKRSYLLCRTMDDTDKILYASTKDENLTNDWEVQGELPGFWENFPEDLKDKVVRIGPGTNPVYIEEAGAYVAGFHWVMRAPDAQAPGKIAEYYFGGLMVLDSITPPNVTKIDPWGMSPMDASEECRRGYTLFGDIEHPKEGYYNKPVVFPVGAAVCDWKGEKSLIVSAGWADTHEHLYSQPITELAERIKKL